MTDWQPDPTYTHLTRRIARRLHQSTLPLIINAVLFTLFTVIVGLSTTLNAATGTVVGAVYWLIFLWSVSLAVHSGYAFYRSGAWARRRERIIEQEVTDVAALTDFTADDLADLHLQLSAEFQESGRSFWLLVINGLGNLILWPGLLVMLLIGSNIGVLAIETIFRPAILLAMLGTGALGLLPLAALRQVIQQRGDRPVDERDRLRDVYRTAGRAKRKHDTDYVDLDRLVELGDDGELIMAADDAGAESAQE
jgi:hypothetical protein